MMKKLCLLFLLSVLFVNCSKEKAEDTHRQLSPLGKKLVGKWALLSFNPAPGDFWEFKNEIVESLSDESLTKWRYTDSVKQSFCNREGWWYEKDSVLFGSCVSPARITKLTDDTLIFKYNGVLEYRWKRIK